MSLVAFDSSINLGQVVTALGFVVGSLGAFYAVKARLAVIEVLSSGQAKSIEGIQEEIRELRKVVQDQARLDVEIATVKREIYDLKTGRGWIIDPSPLAKRNQG